MVNFRNEYYKTMKRICEVAKQITDDYANYPGNLDGMIDRSKLRERDIFEYGLYLIASGVAPDKIDFILGNLMDFAPDADKPYDVYDPLSILENEHRKDEAVIRRIKKEAVRFIQKDWAVKPYKLIALLSSIGAIEYDLFYYALNLYRKNHDMDIFGKVFTDFEKPYSDLKKLNKEHDSQSHETYEDAFYRIKYRALLFQDAIRQKGLPAIETMLDERAMANRDVFDYGMSLYCDGYEEEAVKFILGNLVHGETNSMQRQLKRIQMEAVLNMNENPFVLGAVCDSMSWIENPKPVWEERY